MKYHLARITPTGTQTTAAFVHRTDGCRPERWTEPTYPRSPEGEELRRAREEASVTIGQFARATGLQVSEVSDLERGRLVPTAPTTWADLLAAVEMAKGGAR